MAPFPPLKNWDDTRSGLNRVVQAIAPFRKAFSPQQPNALHLSLYIREFGLTTGRLSFGEIALDIAHGDIYVTVGDELWKVDLSGHTPKSLRDALVSGLAHRGITGDVPANTDDKPFNVDPMLAQEYITALWRISGILHQLRADWLGAVTPLVVWPHGFDASQLWFPNGNPDEETAPHLNFGFSPASEGFARPYIYAYASPMPESLVGAPLPALARWHTGSWTGIVIDYDGLAASHTPDKDLIVALRRIHTLLAENLPK